MPKDSSKKDKKEKKEKKEKKSKKSKKESGAASGAGADAAPESIREPTIPVIVSDIAKPLAGKKLGLDVLRLVQKAALAKELKRGVKEVIKSIRKGGKGLVVLAGDIYPEDVISHIPIYCEEQGVPCVFVESKQQLGSAARTKRATSVVMVPDKGSLGSRASELLPAIKELPKM